MTLKIKFADGKVEDFIVFILESDNTSAEIALIDKNYHYTWIAKALIVSIEVKL